MKTILTLLLLISAMACMSQVVSNVDSSYISPVRNEINETGKLDTVKMKMLITACDNCESRSLIGYAIRRQYSFYSSNYWKVVSYLDYRRHPLPKETTIWIAILKD